MAVYAMADLHLALDNPEKSMEDFGPAWKGYMERIKENVSVISDDDLFLLPGDLSWAMYFDNAQKDFRYINGLPGTKLIIRGNHDYWWGTAAKMQRQLDERGLNSIRILKNVTYVDEKQRVAVTGTRGWKRLEDDNVKAEDIKIHDRELERMKLCLESLAKSDPEHKLTHIMMTHYPPCGRKGAPCDYASVIEESGIVDICLYGHLHGRAHAQVFEGEKNGVKYFCVSADYLNYRPLRVL